MEKYNLQYTGQEVDNLLTKINQAPDAIASESFVKSEIADLINTAPETLDTLGEIAETIETLDTLMETGSRGIINANAPIFNITTDMMGKRIISDGVNGRRINLPSPSSVPVGSMIEIQNNRNSISVIEIYTPNGTIHKGTSFTLNKCIQAGATIKQYICMGNYWLTQFNTIKSSAMVIISPEGSDTETIFSEYSYVEGKVFKTLDYIDILYAEFTALRIVLAANYTVTLNRNYNFSNCELKIQGVINQDSNNIKLIIPSSYSISLKNVDIFLEQLTLLIEGTGFSCLNDVNIHMGGYYGCKVSPNSDVDANLFVISNLSPATGNGGCTSVNFGSRSLSIKTSNIENYSHKLNIFSEGVGILSCNIIINDTGISKDDNCYWYNGLNTISKIGTSHFYTIG